MNVLTAFARYYKIIVEQLLMAAEQNSIFESSYTQLTTMQLLRNSLVLVLLFFFISGRSQITFQSSVFDLVGSEIHSGAAMGMADVNGDALDDLIILDETQDLYVVYQTEGQATYWVHAVGRVTNSINWNLHLADINNDGIQDIFTAGPELTVYKSTGSIGAFRRTTINAPSFLPQAANFGDMDRDGDLDLFVCNDNGPNLTALNNGQGDFSPIDNFLDFSTDPPSDGSGNYASIFSDYDRDGDLDLYISKCRLGSIPGDPERTNQFFENTDTGLVRNDQYPILLSNDQSWVTDFVDVDNDGDWDVLLANHDAPMNLFIKQDDGSYVDEAELRGIDFEAGVIQLICEDFDNDGDVDVFVPGTDHILFENNGQGFFTDGNFPESMRQIESATSGDWNNDGRVDIYAGYANLYNDPSIFPDQLFLNTTDVGNYIKFSLRGDSMNTFAIGSTIEIFHQDHRQLREIRAGEGYGINKSNIQHFGLGDDLDVDSVHIFWPDGSRQTIGTLEANNTFQITKGKSELSIPFMAVTASAERLCKGQDLELKGPDADEYRWSTGSSDSFIVVDQAGVYQLQIRRADQWINLPAYQVIEESTDAPRVQSDGDLNKCQLETITLFSTIENPVVWNTTSSDPALMVVDPGDYFFTEFRTCGEYSSDTIQVANIEVARPSVANDTVEQFASAQLMADDPLTIWTTDTMSQNIIFTGSDLLIAPLNQDSTVYAARNKTTEFAPEFIGPPLPDTATDGYHNTALSGGLFFKAFDDCELVSVRVYCRQAGPRTITIVDQQASQQIFREEFMCTIGLNTLEIQSALSGGTDYLISTDPNQNLNNFGFRSPDFMRSSSDVNFPFIGEFLQIEESTFGTGQFYYFYNWEVKPMDKNCLSYWTPVHAVVDDNVSVIPLEKYPESIVIYPNPNTGTFSIQSPMTDEDQLIRIVDTKGQLIHQGQLHANTTDLSLNLVPGLYFLHLHSEEGIVAVDKIIVHESH